MAPRLRGQGGNRYDALAGVARVVAGGVVTGSAGARRVGCGAPPRIRQWSPQRHFNPLSVYSPRAGARGFMGEATAALRRVRWCAKTQAQVLLRSHEFPALRHRGATNGEQSVGGSQQRGNAAAYALGFPYRSANRARGEPCNGLAGSVRAG
jgi:hypothetical protein